MPRVCRPAAVPSLHKKSANRKTPGPYRAFFDPKEDMNALYCAKGKSRPIRTGRLLGKERLCLHFSCFLRPLKSLLLPFLQKRKLFIYLPLRDEAGVEDGGIADIADDLHPEGAGPHNEPLGGVEGGEARSAPAGMEDRLVLGAGGADAAGDAHGTVGDEAVAAVPEGEGAFGPLAVAGEFAEAEEGEDVVEGVLVDGVMGGGDGGGAHRVVADL